MTSPTTARRAIDRAVAEDGIRIYDDATGRYVTRCGEVSRYEGLDVTLDAPAGRVFAAGDSHTLSITYYSERSEAWVELAADLALGYDECSIEGCEVCAESGGRR